MLYFFANLSTRSNSLSSESSGCRLCLRMPLMGRRSYWDAQYTHSQIHQGSLGCLEIPLWNPTAMSCAAFSKCVRTATCSEKHITNMFQRHLVESKIKQYAFQLKEEVRFRKRDKVKSQALLQPLIHVIAAAD